MARAQKHAECVDAWLLSLDPTAETVAYVDLFQRALNAIYSQVNGTLGQITLRAITDRVLHVAAEEYPFLSSLQVMPDGSVRSDELRKQCHALVADELRRGTRFVLVEVLTVIGGLTAEVLTPDLHDALRRSVDASPPSRRPRSHTRLKDS